MHFLQFLIIADFYHQITKVLTLYTPVIEFEEQVSPAFITTINVSQWEDLINVFLHFYTRSCV